MAQEHRDPRGDRAWMESPNVPPVLKSALIRGAHARYVGRRTVEFWHPPKDFKHEEFVTRDGNRTRVEFPEGSQYAGRIYVEDGHERREYHPEKNEVWILPPRHEESLLRLARMASRAAKGNIVFSTGAGTRVAGYPTEQVVVSDLKGNALQRLFIEPGSGVLLKREVFDAGGAKVGLFEFSQIDLSPPPIDPSLFKFNRNGVRIVTPYDRLKDLATQHHFDPLALPGTSGYHIDEVRVIHIKGEEVLVESYSSHQGKLSMFELRSDVNPDRLREFAREELHAYPWHVGSFTYVLVGNPEPKELARLSQLATTGTR